MIRILFALFFALPLYGAPEDPNGYEANFNTAFDSCSAQTTDATQTACYTQDLPQNSAWKIVCECVGKTTDHSTVVGIDNCALIKRETGSAAIQGDVMQGFDQDGGTVWTADIGVSGNAVQCLVTGEAATTIDWHCSVRRVRL